MPIEGNTLIESPTIQVAMAPKVGWYYLVEAPDELLPLLKARPGVVVDRGRMLFHRNVVDSDPSFKVVYFNAAAWGPPPQITEGVDKLYSEVLRPYQREFVDFALARPGVVNADDMGTGKTLQSLTVAAASGLAPVLVIGTLLSKSVWCGEKSEPMKWLNIVVTPLETRKHANSDVFKTAPHPWFFANYDILEAWMPWIVTHLRPQLVIFDEAHNATPGTKRGRAAQAIARFSQVKQRIVITGTPVRNRRIDLWSVLELAAPGGFGDKHNFGTYFCGGCQGEYGWEYKGETHNEELKLRLQTLLRRRTKAEVLTQLPPLVRQATQIELSVKASEEYAKYSAAEKDIRKYLQNLGTPLATGISGERLVQLTTMLSILSQAKAATTAEIAADTAKQNGKVVVFCWFKEVAKTIASLLKSEKVTVYGPVTGEHGIKKRIDAAQRFADDPDPCAFVATLAAASESINQLAAAQDLVINDLYWIPATLLQAEARLHRGSQKGTVRVVYTLAKNTIDDLLLDVLYRKADVSDAVGLKDDAKNLVKGTGVASAPSDDIAAFINAVSNQLATGGYGIGDDSYSGESQDA